MRGLPASDYLDAARAPLEYSAVFAPSWQFACHVADLPAPGTAIRFDCGGRSAVVLRTKAGGLHAFRNSCRHRGARLVEGDAHTGLAFCIGGHFRCPYHGWSYDESGALAGIPGGQRFDDFDATAHALHPLQVAQWRGLVFLAFGTPQHAVEQVLDTAIGGTSATPMGVYTVAGNGKGKGEFSFDAAKARVVRLKGKIDMTMDMTPQSSGEAVKTVVTNHLERNLLE